MGILDISKISEMETVPRRWFEYLAMDDVDRSVKADQMTGGQIQ